MDKIVGIIVSLAIIGFGLGCFNPKFYRQMVRAINASRGLKTTITPQTDQLGKVVGIIAIIIGFFLFLMSLFK